jgi:hypothetical protein
MRSLPALAAALFAIVLAPQASAAPTIEQIEVRLFLRHTGSFSEPIEEGAVLWNAATGEAGLREPSSSTLIKIVVSASPKAHDLKSVVQLSVREKTSSFKNIMVQGLGAFGADGRQYVAFWLPQTGCDELFLEASVRGSKKTVKRTLPFRCGE